MGLDSKTQNAMRNAQQVDRLCRPDAMPCCGVNSLKQAASGVAQAVVTSTCTTASLALCFISTSANHRIRRSAPVALWHLLSEASMAADLAFQKRLSLRSKGL